MTKTCGALVLFFIFLVTSAFANSKTFQFHENIVIQYEKVQQLENVLRWLTEIEKIQVGSEVLDQIKKSKHQLIIKHSSYSIIAAGLSGAPATSNLYNGKGANATLKLHLGIPDSGSHVVEGPKGKMVPFTAVQNLFHELVHCKHYMNGTWLYFDSEGQAIKEENIFREQEAALNNTDFLERTDINGEQVFFEKED